MIVLILLAGLCSLGSFTFDQLVIQQEDNSRQFNNSREIAKTEYHKLESNINATGFIIDRNSRLIFEAETFRNLPMNEILEKRFINNEKSRYYLQDLLFSHYLNFIIHHYKSMRSLKDDVMANYWLGTITSISNSKKEITIQKMKNLQNKENIEENFYYYRNEKFDEIIDKYKFENCCSYVWKVEEFIEDLSDHEILEIFTMHLDLLNHAYLFEDSLDNLYDELSLNRSNLEENMFELSLQNLNSEIKKNYFILISISLQIFALLFLLLLFKKIIINKRISISENKNS